MTDENSRKCFVVITITDNLLKLVLLSLDETAETHTPVLSMALKLRFKPAEQSNTLHCSNNVYQTSCLHRASTVPKHFFIIPTDAHNYKITGMLKTIIIPIIAPRP